MQTGKSHGKHIRPVSGVNIDGSLWCGMMLNQQRSKGIGKKKNRSKTEPLQNHLVEQIRELPNSFTAI